MARNHARILTSIWIDSDFLTLSSSAQHMYLLLLSQPDLNLCGVVGFYPKRLARLAPELSAAKVNRAITALESRRFVVVDRETDELAIRTFMRHDGVLNQPNVLKAAARAWKAIHSRKLRDLVTESLPAPVRRLWPEALVKMDPKALAQIIRDHEAATAETEGLTPSLPGTLAGNPSPEPIGDLPGSLSLSPTPPPTPPPEPFAGTPSNGTHAPPQPADPEEEIWTLLARRRAALLQAQDDELRGPRWITTVAGDYAGRLEPRRRLLTNQHPDWTTERLADELDADTAERDWSQPTAEETDAYLAQLDRQAAEAVPMPDEIRADLEQRIGKRSPRPRAAGE